MKRPDITPEPWNLQPDNDAGIHHDGGRWVRTDGLFSVRVIGGDFVSRHKPRLEDAERDANARAIAAVPDVLKALEPFAAYFSGDLANMGGGTCVSPSFTIQQFKDARAALLKAGYTF